MANDDNPLGCTWQRYVEHLAADHGGWTALTRLLMERAGPSVGLPDDPGTIERGLRRLKTRGNAPGGQYGHWLLSYFGVPSPLEETARWMGQYHGRFADLPLSLCQAQLWLWDRPPIAESPAASWIHLGLAAIALRRGDPDGARLRLDRVRDATDPAALVEAALLDARLETETTRVEKALAQAQAGIERLPPGGERDCYHARLVDQLAYNLTHTGPDKDLAQAIRLYESIDGHSQAAFARFRRDHGLAYCHWKLGSHDRAVRHARTAATHAGDAGLLRFRVMALQLLARIEPRQELTTRAQAMIAELQHTDL
jgi:hypothetical protein